MTDSTATPTTENTADDTPADTTESDNNSSNTNTNNADQEEKADAAPKKTIFKREDLYDAEHEQKLLKLFVDIALEEADKTWSKHKTKDPKIVVDYKYLPNDSLCTIRGKMMTKGLTVDKYYAFCEGGYNDIFDWEKSCDGMCNENYSIQTIDANHEVVYGSYNTGVWVLSARDFCYIKSRNKLTNYEAANGRRYNVSCSLCYSIDEKHPFYKPVKKKHVRAILKYSGNLVLEDVTDAHINTSVENESKNNNNNNNDNAAADVAAVAPESKAEDAVAVAESTEVEEEVAEEAAEEALAIYVVYLDPCGWIPQWVVNLVAPDQGMVIKQIHDNWPKVDGLMQQRRENGYKRDNEYLFVNETDVETDAETVVVDKNNNRNNNNNNNSNSNNNCEIEEIDEDEVEAPAEAEAEAEQEQGQEEADSALSAKQKEEIAAADSAKADPNVVEYQKVVYGNEIAEDD